jgi:sugar fermentation stimulation protein A
MKIKSLFRAKYIERPNRFTVVFERNGVEEKAHLRDPGRLKELLIPGVSLLIRRALNPEFRKTKYDVIATKSDGQWVLINSGFHSDLADELFQLGLIVELQNYKVEKREYTFGKSRIDFLLANDDDKMLMEVKGCTLVEDGHARFPDAPTKRGRRHLEELIKAKKTGLKSSVLFLITREDAELFSPNWMMDPDFSQSLKKAAEQGVNILTNSFQNICKDDELIIRPFNRVKVLLEP